MSNSDSLWVQTPGDTLLVKGRNAWALLRLIEAGPRGVTPVDEPAGPRWSAYIFNLRKMRFDVETVHEPHGGSYPGNHGRYVLHTPCTIRELADDAA